MLLKKLTKLELKKLKPISSFAHRMLGLFYDKSNVTNETEEKYKEAQPYPAIPMYKMLETLATVRKNFPNHNKLLDVGAGLGNVLLFAQHFYFEPYAIELRDEYIQQLKTLTRNVFHGNCLHYGSYHEMDVIHVYRISYNDHMLRKIYAHIIKNMRPGAILIVSGGLPSRLDCPTSLKKNKLVRCYFDKRAFNPNFYEVYPIPSILYIKQ
jgi:hypothetical protein